jgi:hypothetical protein
MSHLSRFAVIAVAGVLLGSVVLAGTPNWETDEVTITVRRVPVSDAQRWMLLAGTGEEIYVEMCSSCHAIDGTGNPAAGAALGTALPNLALADRSGSLGRASGAALYSAHRALRSECESTYHRTADGRLTMPCWRRIFDETLRDGSQVVFVSSKVVRHVRSLQR